VQGSGCRVQGAGFRVQGSGCRVQGAGFRVQGSGFRAPGSGLTPSLAVGAGACAARLAREVLWLAVERRCPEQLPDRGWLVGY